MVELWMPGYVEHSEWAGPRLVTRAGHQHTVHRWRRTLVEAELLLMPMCHHHSVHSEARSGYADIVYCDQWPVHSVSHFTQYHQVLVLIVASSLSAAVQGMWGGEKRSSGEGCVLCHRLFAAVIMTTWHVISCCHPVKFNVARLVFCGCQLMHTNIFEHDIFKPQWMEELMSSFD